MKANARFKGVDIFSIAGEIAKEIWAKVLAINFIQFFASLFFIMPVVIYMMGIDFSALIQYMNMPLQERMSNPDAMMRIMMGGMMNPSKFILGIVLAMLIGLYIYSWAYNAMYNIAGGYMTDNEEDFGTTLKKANDNRVIRIMGASFLLWVIVMVAYLIGAMIVGLITVAAGSAVVTIILSIGLVFFIMMLAVKFILCFPAIALGDMKIIESLSFSANKITWNKAMKYTMIGIVAAFAIFIAMVLIQLVLGMIMTGSVLMLILSQIAMLIIGAYIGAYVVGAITALYYREAGLYAGEDGEDSFSGVEHLV